MGFFVVVAFGVGVIATAAFDSQNPFEVRAQSSVNTAGEGGEAAPSEVAIELGDVFVDPQTLAAAPGDITIKVHNSGKIEHNLSFGELGATKMLAPGAGATLKLSSVGAGEYEFVCEVPGHAQAGMTGVLTVAGEGEGHEGHEGGSSGSMADMSAEEMAAHDAERTASFPAETKGKGNVVLEPEIDSDGTKVFELTAEVLEWETEPGVVQEAWGYNGMVPGPQLKANLGDRIKIVLHNELPEPTTIHMHGMTLPADMDGVPGISQDAVMPGDSFTYEFEVRNSGTNMYHSHFNAQKQVPMGLLGALIVADPKDPEVDIDYNMVLNDGPLGFTLNGKGFPATEPLVVQKGDVVRIRYMNEGFLIHPMHLHGMPQEVIAKDATC
jgi:plastocyanin